MSDPLDAFKAQLERERERIERSSACCKNCAWFAGSGECHRHPPVRVKGGWGRPAVGEQELCGDFMHHRTGDSYQGDVYRISALRSRVSELEDRIDRMRRDGE